MILRQLADCIESAWSSEFALESNINEAVARDLAASLAHQVAWDLVEILTSHDVSCARVFSAVFGAVDDSTTVVVQPFSTEREPFELDCHLVDNFFRAALGALVQDHHIRVEPWNDDNSEDLFMCEDLSNQEVRFIRPNEIGLDDQPREDGPTGPQSDGPNAGPSAVNEIPQRQYSRIVLRKPPE